MNDTNDKDLNDPELINLPAEKLKRIEICGSCDRNIKAHCSECACPISALTMFSFKTCPIGKW
jgi:hypothetical protein